MQKTDCMGLSKETSLLRCSILSRVNPVEHYKISSGEKDLQKDEVIFFLSKKHIRRQAKACHYCYSYNVLSRLT